MIIKIVPIFFNNYRKNFSHYCQITVKYKNLLNTFLTKKIVQHKILTYASLTKPISEIAIIRSTKRNVNRHNSDKMKYLSSV